MTVLPPTGRAVSDGVPAGTRTRFSASAEQRLTHRRKVLARWPPLTDALENRDRRRGFFCACTQCTSASPPCQESDSENGLPTPAISAFPTHIKSTNDNFRCFSAFYAIFGWQEIQEMSFVPILRNRLLTMHNLLRTPLCTCNSADENVSCGTSFCPPTAWGSGQSRDKFVIFFGIPRLGAFV